MGHLIPKKGSKLIFGKLSIYGLAFFEQYLIHIQFDQENLLFIDSFEKYEIPKTNTKFLL